MYRHIKKLDTRKPKYAIMLICIYKPSRKKIYIYLVSVNLGRKFEETFENNGNSSIDFEGDEKREKDFHKH